jgi:uncharacterized membrane protein YkoI
MTTLACAVALLMTAVPQKHLPLEALPDVVRAAARAKYPHGTVLEAERETGHDGQAVYEVKLSVAGAKIELSVTAHGVLVAEERVVAWKSAPASVRQALEGSTANDLEVERAEQVIEGEQVTWEVVGRRADGRRVEVIIDSRGMVQVKPATE